MTAKEYLKSKGKRELENFKGFTGEYVVTPSEIEDFAKRQAIALAQWLDSFGWRQFQESTWYNKASQKRRATDYFSTSQIVPAIQKKNSSDNFKN